MSNMGQRLSRPVFIPKDRASQASPDQAKTPTFPASLSRASAPSTQAEASFSAAPSLKESVSGKGAGMAEVRVRPARKAGKLNFGEECEYLSVLFHSSASKSQVFVFVHYSTGARFFPFKTAPVSISPGSTVKACPSPQFRLDCPMFFVITTHGLPEVVRTCFLPYLHHFRSFPPLFLMWWRISDLDYHPPDLPNS
jgi:hypothetical protein